MKTIFDSYHEDFNKSVDKSKKLLANFNFINEVLADKKKTLDQIRSEIDKADKSHRKLEAEYTTKDQITRNNLKKKVQDAYSELSKVKDTFNNVEAKFIEQSKIETFNRKNDDGEIDKYERLDNQNKDLKHIANMANATLNMTNDSNTALLEQREKIQKIIKDGEEIQDELDQIDRLTFIMKNRELFTKFLLWALILLLVITNLIVFYMKVTR